MVGKMTQTGKSVWDMVEDVKKSEQAQEEELRSVYSGLSQVYTGIRKEMGKVIVGQENVIEEVLVAIATNNHALLEGFPGLGKTMLIRTLSEIMDLSFKRIQCTPDIMPSDITGTYIIVEDESGHKTFNFERGPIFANIVLADEINRATPKSQSALLESMQERQVTVGNTTYPLDKPFFILATQNPIEMEGTYPLPEAQLDRFLLKIKVDYPNMKDEESIMAMYASEKNPRVNQIISKKQLLSIQDLSRRMPISSDMRKLVLSIVSKTRPKDGNTASKYLDYGASPRASIGLVLASKAKALLEGRNYVSREDVEFMAYPVLRHRLIPNFETERKGVTTDDVIKKIIAEV